MSPGTEMTAVEKALRGAQDRIGALTVGACESLANSKAWDEFDLTRSLDDLRRLRDRDDCCYDRPSIGLNYAMWYHARRTQDVLRMTLRSWERQAPREILDMGAGTGATAWALAIAIDCGLPVERVTVRALDGSPPMLDAADHLWQWLRREPSMAEAAGRVDVEFSCRSWTQPGVAADSPDIIAGYLFDDSDLTRLPEVTAAFRRVAEHYAAPRVHALSSWAKRSLLARVSATLCEGEWTDTREGRVEEFWEGGVPGLRELRRLVLAEVDSDWNWDAAAPTFSHARERPFCVALERRDPVERLDLRATGVFVLDERQSEAADPENRMTVVVGPAGSGKSRVAIERVARLFEQSPSAELNVLVTTFNIPLITQLAAWFDERNTSRLVRRTSGRGDIGYVDEAAPAQRRLRFLNWDKVPTRLFGVSLKIEDDAFADALTRRVALLEDKVGWSLSDAARNNLSPSFLLAELRRVIWGLGVRDLDAYLRQRRLGRGRQLPAAHREYIWEVLMGDGHPVLFDHARMAAKAAARPRDTFTHILVDECQDLTPADFEIAGDLIRDARGLWAFGDKVQALQLGPAYRRPGTISGRNGQGRRWKRYELPSSYRLPLRIAEAVAPFASGIVERDRLVFDGAAEPVDVDAVALEAVTSAVLGMRPIVLAGTQSEILRQIGEVLDTYRRLFEPLEPASRLVTLAEGDRWLHEERVQAAVPEGMTVRVETMRAIKGLERAAVIWSSRTQLDADEASDEWIYTILSRTTGLLIILLSEQMDTPAAGAVRRLRRDRLLPWTRHAEKRLDQIGSGAVT